MTSPALKAMAFALACLYPALASAQTTGGYRGLQNNGIYAARGLLKEWPPGGPKLLWKQPLGIGYAGVTVVADRVYIAGGGGQCSMFEFSIEGELLKKIPCGSASWKRFSGTRCTPLVVGDVVVTTTPNADIFGLDLAEQTTRWKRNAWKDFGTGEGNMGWGLPETPMLVGEKVIFNACSRNDQTPPIVAIDIHTGKTVWEADAETGRKFSAGDVSGSAFTHNGRKLVAYPTWRSFLCLDAETGRKLWEMPDPNGSEKILAPVYNEGFLLTMPNGKVCRMVKLSDDGEAYTALWERPWRGNFSQALILDGRAYLFGDANDESVKPVEGEQPAVKNAPRGQEKPVFLCLDAQTGQVIQSYPSAEGGHIVAADGMVFTLEKMRLGRKQTHQVRVRLVRPRPSGFEITGQFIPDLTDEELSLRDIEWEGNVNPVIAEGRMFLRYGPLMCFDIRAEPPSHGFRGDGTGVARFVYPPERPSPQDGALWTCKLPSADASSPALTDGRAYLAAGGKLVCVDAASGKVLWQRDCAKAAGGEGLQPVPVARENLVVAVFRGGEVACFDRDGQQQWTAQVEPPAAGAMASPVLCDDALIVQGKELSGLSIATGEKLWSAALPEAGPFGTPAKVRLDQLGGRNALVTCCGMVVQAYDGRVVVRYNPADKTPLPPTGPASPALAGSKAYFCGNRPDGSEAFVYSCDLEKPDKERRQFYRRDMKVLKDVRLAGSPQLHEGLLYCLTDKQELMVFDAAGEAVYRQALLEEAEQAESASAGSLAAAAGHIYAAGLGKAGRTVVFEPGREFRKVHEWKLPNTVGDLAFEGDRLYVRAGDKLYCLGARGK